MHLEKLCVHLIAAARPNFMKIAPLYHAMKKESWLNPVLIHTGQHYDLNMSDIFFQDLGLPAPDIHLGIGSGSHAEQTGQVMIAFEKTIKEFKPELVIVVGDVNSTMACTIAAKKFSYTSDWKAPGNGKQKMIYPLVAHLEAGLRSFDRSMPEEINRLVTDALADILWTPSSDGDAHLLREGVDPAKILRVGNIMIDSLEMLRGKIESMETYTEFNVVPREYGLVTLHRPSNVDDMKNLEALCRLLGRIAKNTKLIFPAHPRTLNNLNVMNLLPLIEKNPDISLVEPQGYSRFMNLVFNSRMVITDSGGVQEETSYLGIPCFTLRANTERPITVERGTNHLCTIKNLEDEIAQVFSSGMPVKPAIELWDGKTAERVVESTRKVFLNG